MITRGIIEGAVSPYKYKVRMPMLDGSVYATNKVSSGQINECIVCSPPNVNIKFQIGDVVIVAFEDGGTESAIIIGYLFRDNIDTVCDIIANDISANGNVKLSASTSIGDITYEQLKYLTGVKSNVQKQIDYLTDKVNNISDIKSEQLPVTQVLLKSPSEKIFKLVVTDDGEINTMEMEGTL